MHFFLHAFSSAPPLSGATSISFPSLMLQNTNRVKTLRAPGALVSMVREVRVASAHPQALVLLAIPF